MDIAPHALQLVIFDCDGVLVDSEIIAHEVLIEVVRELGLTFGLHEAMQRFMGNTLAGTVAIIEAELGRSLPEDFMPAWRERLYAELRRRPVRAVDGVEAALDALNVPSCVVSNGPVQKMQTTLGVTGLLERFEDALFSPGEGLRGKPHPDLFLAAARNFGVDPAATLVIEDSPTGVRGAKTAGMHAWGFAGAAYTDAEALRVEGARVFHAMHELTCFLSGEGD